MSTCSSDFLTISPVCKSSTEIVIEIDKEELERVSLNLQSERDVGKTQNLAHAEETADNHVHVADSALIGPPASGDAVCEGRLASGDEVLQKM